MGARRQNVKGGWHLNLNDLMNGLKNKIAIWERWNEDGPVTAVASE